ncbi:RBBP9/YdeN family alpha/beta hydrolase [Lichenifustis flavocetrariae]|uniref:Alpha/beta hydrolase n=1 Tax=Lichenifustis flavocetrariae TaxID=2949735 RepID=A0AA41YSN8_9HYPH|nr:alpha/beta hydrolase [Lichenifustis flavocetrariae]MCW6506476.1 alpha/beta hydrolase [Lichenifustis flavocetrariae]
MKSRDADILILPGLGGSGPDHWQSRWQAKLSSARRIEQADWAHPEFAIWGARIAEAVAEAERPVVLVAHSLGVIAAAHVLAVAGPGRVAGAFLVAPPAEASVIDIPEIATDFRPYPTRVLPCPTVLVASTDDPYCTLEASEALASHWGSSLLNAGAAGHINTASGHGPWPEGLMAFAGFLTKL